jgi:hypothetical protein
MADELRGRKCLLPYLVLVGLQPFGGQAFRVVPTRIVADEIGTAGLIAVGALPSFLRIPLRKPYSLTMPVVIGFLRFQNSYRLVGVHPV